MQAREQLQLDAGVGVRGDRYARGGGTWAGWPDAEVTLVELEVSRSLGLDPLALRRNIVTDGLRLSDLIGRRFALGTAQLAGVRHCDPCMHLERTLQHPGLVLALANGRGGLRARVVDSGIVRVGDEVLPLPESL